MQKNPNFGFEPRAFGVGSDWSANWAKTTAQSLSLSYATINVEEILASITVAVWRSSHLHSNEKFS